MTAMFETLEELNRRLTRPKLTGDGEHDLMVRQYYIANAKTMRSEAFACLGRSMVKSLKKAWFRLTHPGFPVQSRHA
ncbi:MAG: hypothetical protein ACRBM6_03860 [Geminicoccales bacterium]